MDLRKIHSAENLSKTCAIIMPVYNEQDALDSVLAEWHQAAKEINGTLVVINDGSKDGSLDILKQAATRYDSLVILDKDNSGHASTCLKGYQWAIEQDFEWIFQTDSDGQVNAQEFLTKAWPLRDHFSFIFGFRPIRGDGAGRWIISRTLRFVILCVFGVYVPDANIPFRLMRTQALSQYFHFIPSDVFLANAYLTVVLQRCKDSIHWVNIKFAPRVGGAPSVSWAKFFKVGPRVIKEYISLRQKFFQIKWDS